MPRRAKSLHVVCGLLLLVCSSGSAAAPDDDERDLAIGLGVGLLQFIHFDAGVEFSPSWSAGVSVGWLPIDPILRAATGLDTVEVAEEAFSFSGAVDTGLVSAAAWVRWYPWQARFYVEGMLAVWKLSASVGGFITHQDIPESIPVEVGASVWAPLVGLHCGWRFVWDNGALLDVGLGIDTMQSPGASVSLGGATVEEIRAQSPEAAALLESVQQELATSLSQGAENISKNFTFPTVYVKFGWRFDIW